MTDVNTAAGVVDVSTATALALARLGAAPTVMVKVRVVRLFALAPSLMKTVIKAVPLVLAAGLKLKVPMATQHAAPLEPVKTEKERFKLRKPLKILVVDDNAVNLLVAKKMLKKMGAEVTVAENGQLAVDKAAQADFDFVFMDIQMPVLDGYNATIQLRSMNFTKPIVALSANAYSNHITRSIECGMNSHIQKPFNEKQLYDAINEFVDWDTVQ